MFEFELSLLNFVVDTAPEDDNVEIKEEPIDDAELSSSKNDRLQPYYSEGLISDDRETSQSHEFVSLSITDLALLKMNNQLWGIVAN